VISSLHLGITLHLKKPEVANCSLLALRHYITITDIPFKKPEATNCSLLALRHYITITGIPFKKPEVPCT